MSSHPLPEGFSAVHVYTRAQAIADGVLVDVTATAREAGFRVPVAVTAAVWADCVAWNQALELHPQDEAGRLWDLLRMAELEARRAPAAAAQRFGVLRVPSRGWRPELVELMAHIGAGDDGEPVITIMQPGED
jgi:hypothetical protein